MDNEILGPAELLTLEEKQLYYFLTEVRHVGEEKSELYPEPQYFNMSYISVGAQLPRALGIIIAKSGSVEAYAHKAQRVLSPVTALHLSGLPFMVAWGREFWLFEEPGADRISGVITTADGATLSDRETARILCFSDAAVRNYRQDGRAHPNPAAALGADYRILGPDAAAKIAAATTPTDATQAQEVLGLLAAVRAISFLMEAETREALMMHGPYPTEDGGQLVLFECVDLHWSLFPNFPLPGDVRWTLPDTQFPVANLAIALVLRDVNITSDRFGTLYIDPLGPEKVISASLLTRGKDAYVDEGLSQIPLGEARSLRRLCDEIQEFMFLQIACWDLRQRMAAGVFQEHMYLLRMISAAGCSRDEILAEQQHILATSEPITRRYFESILARSTEQLPFYQKLGAFVAGTVPQLFTPLSHVTKCPEETTR